MDDLREAFLGCLVVFMVIGALLVIMAFMGISLLEHWGIL